MECGGEMGDGVFAPALLEEHPGRAVVGFGIVGV